MWAEQIGIGEMGLSPRAFWSLTYREFQIKHQAFQRAENRLRALVHEMAMMVPAPGRTESGYTQMARNVNELRQYPEKAWLQSR